MNKWYKFLFSIRDFISFLTGMIVSGYVVEISINSENTNWHWGSVICGLLFGFTSYLLIRISKNFYNNLTANKNNIPTNSTFQNERLAWQSITDKTLPLNKLFGFYPQFWMRIISFSLFSLLICGFLFLRIGNRENHQQYEIRNEKQTTELIRKIDSINRQLFISYKVEKELYQDSLRFTKIQLKIQAKKIDSLENFIRIKKGHKKIKQNNEKY